MSDERDDAERSNPSPAVPEPSPELIKANASDHQKRVRVRYQPPKEPKKLGPEAAAKHYTGSDVTPELIEQDPEVLERDLKLVPDWVIEAEPLYISKRLSTTKAVAMHYGHPEGTVRHWALRRHWTARRERAEEVAAQRLQDKIDEEATAAMVDQFASMDQDVIVAGQICARLARAHMQDELKAMTNSQSLGKRYIAMGVHKTIVDGIRMAQELRPKPRTNQQIDDLGSVLNPEDAAALDSSKPDEVPIDHDLDLEQELEA